MGVADAAPPRWNPQESNVLSRLETNERLATKLLSPECSRALKKSQRVEAEELAMLKTLIVLTTGLAIFAFAATAVAHRLIERLLSG